MGEVKYFFSYARKDSEFVLKLAQDLRAVGVNLWLDQLDILGGREWDWEIEGALKDCQGMIAILSPASVYSNNFMNEVSYALEEGKLVVPVLLSPCDKPFRLRRLQHIDFTTGYDKGFSELLRALGIEQPSQPPKPELPQKPFVRKVTKPLNDKPGEKHILASPKPMRRGLIGILAGLFFLVLIVAVLWLMSGRQPKEIPATTGPGTFTNSIGMKFVFIPKGSFKMGSTIAPEELVKGYGGKADAFKNEYPLHKVAISKPFYLQTTEVTQGQWEKVMGDDNPSYFNPCDKDHPKDCPVERVSWNDARKFIEKLNQMEKTEKYRLPTEAEWEYACRAGSTSNFYYGDDGGELGKYAWYAGNSNWKTHPVGLKKPNNWGLYDMLGNVYEWCQDWKEDYSDGPVNDPKGPPSGKYRVLRGGAYVDKVGEVRSARRGYKEPDFKTDHLGFRVARDF